MSQHSINIVVTDGYTLNPGDLHWQEIAALGHLTVYDRTTPAEILDRCRDADIVLTNKVPFTGTTLAQLSRLHCISVLATGYNVIDTAAAKAQGIVVCNVPGYGTASVAQHTIALLLELTNAVGKHHKSVQDGHWQRSSDWCYTVQPVVELAGKILGIVGMGSIGTQVAHIATALGMRVVYYNPSNKTGAPGTQVSLEQLARESDFISLHCPLTPQNTGMVNNAFIRLMKPTASIINTARGPLINESELAEALNNKRIAGAALDVLSAEPPVEGNPLLQARNCIITPHNAWVSKEARQRIMEITKDNIRAYLDGNPQHRVA